MKIRPYLNEQNSTSGVNSSQVLTALKCCSRWENVSVWHSVSVDKFIIFKASLRSPTSESIFTISITRARYSCHSRTSVVSAFDSRTPGGSATLDGWPDVPLYHNPAHIMTNCRPPNPRVWPQAAGCSLVAGFFSWEGWPARGGGGIQWDIWLSTASLVVIKFVWWLFSSFLLQLFLDDSKMKNFTSCFKGTFELASRCTIWETNPVALW